MKPIILADSRIPRQALKSLTNYGEVIEVFSNRIVYQGISGHPDIFFCRTGKGLIYAPNTPQYLIQKLTEKKVTLIPGRAKLEKKYPATAMYNALVSDRVIIHNPSVTDPGLAEMTVDLERIDVRQGYTRCNTVALNDNRFITSDRGIESVLLQRGMDVLYVNPETVVLPGFPHGFFGGTCGIFDQTLFLIGSLDHFPESKKLKSFLKDENIIELCGGPLFDGGSLIFLP